MKKLTGTILLTLSIAMIQGCAALVIGGAATTAGVAHDRRTAGTVIDDNTLEIQAYDLLYKDTLLKDAAISSTSYNLILLLTGQVPSAEAKSRASAIVSSLPKVKKVHNELEIGPNTSFGRGTQDTILTTKVKTRLFNINMEDFDPTRVKVKTENGVVYLMGLVTRAEGEAVGEQARLAGGVLRVVKVFEYID